MQDQANGLRDLIRESGERSSPTSTHRPRTLIVTSGKGGVGKTNLAVNLAICLRKRGRRVVLVDAARGFVNVAALCQITCSYNVLHVLRRQRSLSDALVPGPADVRVLPGASGIGELADVAPGAASKLVDELEGLVDEVDDLVLDAGRGLDPGVRDFIVAADSTLLVTTPEPTAITDAYAVVKALTTAPSRVDWNLVLNQASSPAEAHQVLDRIGTACERFLGLSVIPAGYVLADPHVSAAVHRRRPLVLEYPACPASRSIGRLADWLVRELIPVSKLTRKRPQAPSRLSTRTASRRQRVVAR